MRAFAFVVASLVITSCSFLVPFDPEGLPCGDNGACLTDAGRQFVCVDKKCVSVDSGVPMTDGGVRDAGP